VVLIECLVTQQTLSFAVAKIAWKRTNQLRDLVAVLKFSTSERPLESAQSAIGHEFTTNRKCSFVGGQKYDCMSYFTGIAEALHENLIVDGARNRL